jgi:hypothetical protein
MTDRTEPTSRRRSAPTPVTYEVQVFAAGKWATELVLQDRQDAEDEAIRTLESSRRPLGVRVVREEYDEKTQLINATTVFRRSREDEQSAEDREDKRVQMKAKVAEIRADKRQSTKVQPVRAEAPRTAAAPGRKPAPASKSFHWVWLVVLLVVLIIAGLLTLVKLHSVFLE